MSNEELKPLEEKIAYLERHVTEQDKAMLEMADGIARLPKPRRLRPQRKPREPNVFRKSRARPSRPKLRFRQLI